MFDDNPLVVIIDDDDSVREALLFLMKSMELHAVAFSSAREYLSKYENDVPGCIVSDIRMPGTSGLALQQELSERGSTTPIIFITGHGDIPMAVEAIKKGAEDFLTKPFCDQKLLDCINSAIEKDRYRRREQKKIQSINSRLATLTRREHQVLEMVAAGKSNKAIAAALNLSHRTIEVHRSHVMEKMKVSTLTDLLVLLQGVA